MLRAPSAAIFRAATKRKWASPPAAAAAAPSSTVVYKLPSHQNYRMMLSIASPSVDELDGIASHNRNPSPGDSVPAITTTTTTTTTAATIFSTTTSTKNVLRNFITSASHNYVHAMTNFFHGGDLTWSMTSSSSSRWRVMEVLVGERRKAVDEDAARETTPESLSLSSSSSSLGLVDNLAVWLISTLKRRKKMMNKHKLRKRRKKLRLKTRK